jgi:hypothetical protein
MDLDLFDAFDGKTLQNSKDREALRIVPERNGDERPEKRARVDYTESKLKVEKDNSTIVDTTETVFIEQKTATTKSGTLTTVCNPKS